MPGVLAVVPLVGRPALAWGPFNGTTPLRRSVEAAAAVVSWPVVVLADGYQMVSANAALTGCPVSAEIVNAANDSARLLEAAGAADVLLVHDPMCPLVTTESLAEVLDSTTAGDAAAAVRPVVDTLKISSRGVVVTTVDREGLRVVISPVVLPADLFAEMPDPAATLDDLAKLVQWLRMRVHVRLVMAAGDAGRITDPSSSRLMMAADLIHGEGALRRSADRRDT